MSHEDFVPPDFIVPARLETELFTLEPLGPEHNERDYDAWTSSKEHIHATPGWHDSSWPRAMTLDENRGDLERHADDFRKRTGFTYTVLDRPSGDVIGCVYIYPDRDSEHDARVLAGSGESRRPGRSVVAERRRLDRRGVAVPQRRVRRTARLGVLQQVEAVPQQPQARCATVMRACCTSS